jgi:hypothetical protein
MKNICRILLLMLAIPLTHQGQIITPVIKANFGVDADLRCNFFNGLVQSGNDDWFKLPGSIGTGQFVVDTTGAASILAGYTSNPSLRKLPFYRTMRFPNYAVINNRLLIDAYYVRDYHGDDSTIFAAGSNKNGMSPIDWSCPVSQSIPDKNEILDIMLHVRRAGPNLTDSMWLMGGISIENTTGNRYFDFEMYQTDIFYNRATRQFYNYGPDAGHTRWQFDASGNMIKPGDIILTAEYGSSSLTFIEARIWVDRNDLTITPTGFSWSGSFDGASNSSQYGYAGIQPKTAGAFYTGLQSVNNTWAGPFSLVLGDNSVITTYTAKQYMEFSVNLSKLGLDDARIFGGDDCLMPFRRVMVKTRASTSFTSELKDFVAPFDFFLAPRAEVETMLPMICDTGNISNIYVVNPIPTSIYQWSTINGNIVGPTTGTSINVDTPGVYIVKQYLQADCSVYASDTITIGSLGSCDVLHNNLIEVNSQYSNKIVTLSWKVTANELVSYFNIERSFDGQHFEVITQVPGTIDKQGEQEYSYADFLGNYFNTQVYYRISLLQVPGNILQSKTLYHRLLNDKEAAVTVYPNPVKQIMQLRFTSPVTGRADLKLLNGNGQIVLKGTVEIMNGNNSMKFVLPENIPTGHYILLTQFADRTFTNKLQILK